MEEDSKGGKFLGEEGAERSSGSKGTKDAGGGAPERARPIGLRSL